MENVYWRRTVSTLIGSIWLYTLAGIAGGIVDVVSAAMNPLDILQYLQSLAEGRGASSSARPTAWLPPASARAMCGSWWLWWPDACR